MKRAVCSKTVLLTIPTAIIAVVLSRSVLSVLGISAMVCTPFALIEATLHTTNKKTGFILSFVVLGLIICFSGFDLFRKAPVVQYTYGPPYEIHSSSDVEYCRRHGIHNACINIEGVELTNFEWVKTRNGVDYGTEYYYAIIQTSAGKTLLRYYETKPKYNSTLTVYLTGFSAIDEQVYNVCPSDVMKDAVFISADKYVVDNINLEKTTMLFLVYSLLLSCFIGYDGIKRYRNREIYINPTTNRTPKHKNGSGISRRTGNNTNVESNESNNEIEYSVAVAIAEGSCEALKNKGLMKYLLSDFNASTFLSYGDFGSRKKTYQKLNLIFIDILKYLNLPPFIQLNIAYEDGEIVQGKTTSGSYSNEFQNKTITVKIRPEYGPNNVVAILCHECTHYFMEHNHLNWIDTTLNEVRTDVMANLIGFSRILIDGYREIVNTKANDNIETTTTHRIGYITVEECENVRRYLLSLRKELLAQQEQNLEYKAKTTELRKLLDVAVILNQQLEIIDPRINRDIGIESKEQVDRLSNALIEYEARDLPTELHQYEEMLNNGSDISVIKSAISSLKELCADILRWSAAFQGRQP